MRQDQSRFHKHLLKIRFTETTIWASEVPFYVQQTRREDQCSRFCLTMSSLRFQSPHPLIHMTSVHLNQGVCRRISDSLWKNSIVFKAVLIQYWYRDIGPISAKYRIILDFTSNLWHKCSDKKQSTLLHHYCPIQTLWFTLQHSSCYIPYYCCWLLFSMQHHLMQLF